MNRKNTSPSDTVIAVDFDGTVVTHEYPNIGRNIGAVPYLRKLSNAGVKLILLTMRSNRKGLVDRKGRIQETDTLQDAVNWFDQHGIKLWGINRNPEQDSWTDSPKVYAHLFVDDAGINCPLVCSPGERPYVDWNTVGPMLLEYAGVDESISF